MTEEHIEFVEHDSSEPVRTADQPIVSASSPHTTCDKFTVRESCSDMGTRDQYEQG